MSITKLNNLSISAITALPSGVGGKVLQVKQLTDVTVITTTSTSFVTTGISQSITPSSASNKVLISINGGSAYASSTAGATMRVTVKRGATDLATLGASNNGLERFSTVGGNFNLSPHSIMWLDSPSTTSSTTYEIFFRNDDAAATVQFNNSDRGILTYTLMEIAG